MDIINYKLINLSNDKDNPAYMICYKEVPLHLPNRYLEKQSKDTTKVDYGRTLVRFFNYFEDTYGIVDYRKIKRTTAIDDYMRHRIYKKKFNRDGKTIYITDDETNITFQTAKKEMTIVQGFFIYLDGLYLFDVDSIDPGFIQRVIETNAGKRLKSRSKDPQYTGIWSVRSLDKLPCIVSGIRWKAKRKYRRSFTSEEINILESNLKGIRNKCIFLSCLETGARITEILTLKKRHFKINKSGHWVLGISESKTEPRYVYVPEYLRKLIQMYINTERKKITNNQSGYEYLFVSSKGDSKGDRISYHTFRNALKRSAIDGYLDPKDICTHMSRSTKATRMKELRSSNPEILKQLGNKSEYKAYIDFANPDIVVPVGKPLYNIDIK